MLTRTWFIAFEGLKAHKESNFHRKDSQLEKYSDLGHGY